MDYKAFFKRKAKEVAPDLPGRILIRRTDSGIFAVEISEAGAYSGGEMTPARQGMLYEPGRIFLMPVRGSLLLNIACGEACPECVDIREVSLPKLKRLEGVFNGQHLKGAGAISSFLELNEKMDNLPLGEFLAISSDKYRNGKIISLDLKDRADNCIGIYRFAA